ncbi:MAG: acyl carrier protein [Deltaproteobacteria bacterium]|nr:acyl carrier protein [Deltaproteobacteria bacterium]
MTELRSLHERIARIFSEQIRVEVPSVDTDLFETSILDSLGLVDLVVWLEQEFDVRVTVEDLEIDNFRSIASIAEFTAKKIKLAA